MSAEEEYLDQLLAQALNPKKEKKEPEEKTVIAETAVPADDVGTAGTVEEDAADGVMESAEGLDDISGDFDVPQPVDVPELDLNSQGAKDFNLDGISADELASEIEAFEEDADDSVLPTGEGGGFDEPADSEDISDAAEDAGDITAENSGEDALEDIDALSADGLSGAADPVSDEEIPGAADGDTEPAGLDDISEAMDSVGEEEMPESAEDIPPVDADDMAESDVQDEGLDMPEDADSAADTELPENIDDPVSEEADAGLVDEGTADADPGEEKTDDAVNDVAEAEAIDDINAVDDMISDAGDAGLIDDGAISDFSEDVDAEGEADDLMSLLKGDGGDDDIQSDLSELADMDPDDLEARIAAAEADIPGESLPSTEGDADILDMLSDMDVLDGDLGDIKDVLEKSDNNEAVNADLLKEPDVGPDSFDDDSEEDVAESGKKSKKKKKEKKKKEKGEKGSFFAKLFGKKKKDKDTDAEGDGEAASEAAPEAADAGASADMDLLDDMSDIPGDISEGSASDAESPDADGEDDGSGKKKKKKGEKKKGLIAALLEAVFYEEEDEASPEEGTTKLSDENKQILNELDAEDEEKGKKKKKKPKKEKKPKEKKPKKSKEKKPKKEKAPGEEEKGPKIPKKYIIRSAAFAVSVLAAAIVLAVFLPKANVMKSARTAYYDHDYKEAFYSMYGKKLNESDQLIYDRSKTIILMDRKYESYGQYKAMGMNDRALDALFQGLKRYEALKTEAETLGVKEDIDATRNLILAALQNDFGVSEEQAMEIIDYNKTDYTGAVNAILRGEPYVKMQDAVNAMYGLGGSGSVEPETPEGDDAPDTGLPDMLPEEERYILENGTDPGTRTDADTPEENSAEDNTEEENTDENAPEAEQSEDNADDQHSTNIIVDTEDNVQVQIDSTQF